MFISIFYFLFSSFAWSATTWIESPDATNNASGDASQVFWQGVNGSVIYDTSLKHNGKGSWKADSGAGNARASMDTLGGAQDSGTRLSIYVNASSIPTTTRAIVFALGGSTVVSLRLNTTGVLSLASADGTLSKTGTTVLSAATWYHLSFCFVIVSTAVFTIKVYINSISEMTATGSDGTLGATGASHFTIGWANGPGANKTLNFENLYIDNGTDLTDPGGGAVDALYNRLLMDGEKSAVESVLLSTFPISAFSPGQWLREYPAGTQNGSNRVFTLFKTPADLVVETPAGTMDDSNLAFTLSKGGNGLVVWQNRLYKPSLSGSTLTLPHAPSSGDTLIYWRGGLLVTLNNHFVHAVSSPPSSVHQYSLSGRQITLGVAPDPGDHLVFYYPVLHDPGADWVVEDLIGTKDGINDLFAVSHPSSDEPAFVIHQNLFARRVPSVTGGGQHSVYGAAIQMGSKPASTDTLWRMYATK